jgi:hypothetical protein
MMAEAGWLQEELGLLKKLLDLTLQIDHALQSEDLSSVGDLLDSRGKILTKISGCAERARSVRRGLMTGNDGGRMSGLIDEIGAVYEKIAGVEQKIQARLESEKDRVHHRMLSARHAHRALRGYAPHRMGVPRFFDKKG